MPRPPLLIPLLLVTLAVLASSATATPAALTHAPGAPSAHLEPAPGSENDLAPGVAPRAGMHGPVGAELPPAPRLSKEHAGAGRVSQRDTAYQPRAKLWVRGSSRGTVEPAGVPSARAPQGPKPEPHPVACNSDTAACTSVYGNTLLWAGAHWDSQVRLYDMRARRYDPYQGIFLSPDPLGYVDSFDEWLYAAGDPFNLWDPWGLKAGGRRKTSVYLGRGFKPGIFDLPFFPSPLAAVSTTLGVAAAAVRVSVPTVTTVGAAVADDAALATVSAASAAAGGATRALGGLSRAAEFGLKPYGQLRQAIQGTGLQAHHLIEQRFAGLFGGAARSQGLSVAVTQAEHQAFANAWRARIPYGPSGTGAATRESVLEAARDIYRNYPEILSGLGL